jgi:predicted nucleic acid-binding protein
MNVVDSSGWLEYFGYGPNADFFAPALENTGELIVPSISIYEVFKKVFQESGEDKALQTIAAMYQGLVVDLNASIALIAARISLDLKLPMADSIILATARAYDATLWTQDSHFRDIEDIQYMDKR